MQRSAIVILSGVFATFISAKSYAQEVIVIKKQPPVPKIEVIEGPPASGLHWIQGHWKWKDDNFVWVKGRWSKPPIPTALWEPDQWGWSCWMGLSTWALAILMVYALKVLPQDAS